MRNILKSLSNLLQNGVQNNFNVPINNCLDRNYPYSESYYIDNGTTKISSAILYYTVKRISDTTGEFVQDYEPPKDFIRVFIDGKEAATINDVKGTIELTQYIAAQAGWHEIEIHSNSLIMVSGQLCVRSYVNA